MQGYSNQHGARHDQDPNEIVRAELRSHAEHNHLDQRYDEQTQIITAPPPKRLRPNQRRRDKCQNPRRKSESFQIRLNLETKCQANKQSDQQRPGPQMSVGCHSTQAPQHHHQECNHDPSEE